MLACCTGAGFATLLDSGVVNYAVPSLGTALDAPTSGLQWFLSVYSLTFGLGLVPGGRLGDAIGRRRLFVLGLTLFATGAIASAAAPTIWWAVAARAAQGLGAGLISAQVLGIVQDTFTGLRRVRALAAYTAAGAAAAVVGPLGAGLVIAALPADLAWRAVLALTVPFVLATLLLTLRFVPHHAAAERAVAGRAAAGRAVALDLPGILLVGGFVLLVTVPVIDPGIDGAALAGILGVCAALAAATVVWERRYAARGGTPLFVPALVSSRGFVVGNAVALLWFGGVIAYTAVLTIYLLQGLGWSALVVAALLIPGALAQIAASTLSARVFARFGGWTLPVALGVQVLCPLVVAATTGASGFLLVIVLTKIVFGVAAALFEPPLRAVTLSFAPPGHHGVAASFLQLTQRLSATFCVALVTGVVLGTDLHAVTADGLRQGLLICAAFLGVATVLALSPALRLVPAAT